MSPRKFVYKSWRLIFCFILKFCSAENHVETNSEEFGSCEKSVQSVQKITAQLGGVLRREVNKSLRIFFMCEPRQSYVRNYCLEKLWLFPTDMCFGIVLSSWDKDSNKIATLSMKEKHWNCSKMARRNYLSVNTTNPDNVSANSLWEWNEIKLLLY